MALTFGFLLLLTTVALVITIFTSKREDVSWAGLFLAGPFVVVRPEQYLRPTRVPRIPKLVMAWLALFVLTGIAAAVEA